MILSAIAHVFTALLELIRISRMSDQVEDLEILVLRYQLGIADRKLNCALKPDKREKLTLAVLVNRLKQRKNETRKDCSPKSAWRHHQ